MSQINEQRAYQRGIRAARLWQRIKGTILRWDRLCVTKARERNLPGWTGHIPVVTLAVSMLSIFLFGGIIIASSATLFGALTILVNGAFSSEQNDTNQSPEEDYFMNYSTPSNPSEEEDYFMHCAKHGQFDGPYTSPGETD